MWRRCSNLNVSYDVPYNQPSYDQNKNRKEGDRDLSRSNPKKLNKQLKSNDQHDSNMSMYVEEGRRLVEYNLALRCAITASTDVSLVNTLALVPYLPSKMFSSSSTKSNKRKDSDDED
jgi:hypothetical protein